MNPIIEVQNLSKLYRIGAKEAYGSLREEIMQAVTAPFRRYKFNTSNLTPDTDTNLWALKDVSFEVNEGEVVGIIGKNGAGKSTLLKILSRITEPTSGRVVIKGRVASLLEVGTGFHPELTGRENIFLNGALLGMTKTEIRSKFDEIVAFSEIEKFLDTPVKRYSSGMYVRLAFAVAAHLEPEILIVDEVLAVGDASFQKKCLGKMEDTAKTGKTVLFVSHNMGAVQNLCQRAILLHNGYIVDSGGTDSILKKYISDATGLSRIPLLKRTDREGSGDLRFSSVFFQNENRENINTLFTGQNIKMIFLYENYTKKDLRNLNFAVGINNNLGHRITVLNNEITGEVQKIVPAGANKIEINIEKLPLLPGRYTFTIFCTINGIIADWIQCAGFFDVESGDYFNSGKLPITGHGDFLLKHHFCRVE